jgi:hypothetical protein
MLTSCLAKPGDVLTSEAQRAERADLLLYSEIRPCLAPWLTASARLLTASLV